ncbi:MAG: hypothetical protein H6744_17765 [Deltaproteobacteria bacterium]|nr:hypothetical protein [Deltaproteobacteria bacterium]
MRHPVTRLLIVCALLAGCKSRPAPAPAPAPAAPATAVQAAPPAGSPAPPEGSAAVPAVAAADRPDRNEWGKVLSETIEAGVMTRKVQSPWGPITVSGPTEEPGVTLVRYWTDWLRADFPSAFAHSTGKMRKGLALLDNPDGRHDYIEAIAQRYADNPLTAFHVVSVTTTGEGQATAATTQTHRDGKTEARTVSLVLEGDTWKLANIAR